MRLTPGSYRIRPTREDAEQCPDAFYHLLDGIRADLSLSDIADVTDEQTNNPTVNLHKKIKNKTLPAKARTRILRHAFDDAQLFSGHARAQLGMIEDAPYFALLNFFSAKETSQDKARARALGIYRFWRASVEHDDEFVFGKIEFSEDPATRAVHARMTQAVRHPDGTVGAKEFFNGYLFRFAHMYVMLLRDTRTNDPRISLFPTCKIDEVGIEVHPSSIFEGRALHVVYMDGYCLGVDGGRSFFAPIHLSLEQDTDKLVALDNEIDIVADGDPRLPHRIAKKLRANGPLRRL